MKKGLAVLLVFCMIFSFPFIANAAGLGDVDGDREITAADARLALRAAVGLENYQKGSAQFVSCDVDKDGAITASDARIILRVAVGLETLSSNPDQGENPSSPDNPDPDKPTTPTKLTSSEVYNLAKTFMFEIHVDTDNGSFLGSGFSISKTGKIVTNYHVIEGAKSITVEDYNGKTYQVNRILSYDEELDIAVLKISASTVAAVLNKEEYGTGDRIYTLGSSKGFTGTFSEGIISTRDREGPTRNSTGTMTYIQITAPISQGNSGGPLLDEYGRVIGINTLTYTSGQNLNFAVPIYYLDNLENSSSITVDEYYTEYSKMKIWVPTYNLTLIKGGLALLPVIVTSKQLITIVYSKNTTNIKTKWGEWLGDEIYLYISADSICSNEKIRIYIEENPSVYVDITVSVVPKSMGTQTCYYNYPDIPDLGVMTSVPVIDVTESADHKGHSAYYSIRTLYYNSGYSSLSALRNSYFSLVTKNNFELVDTYFCEDFNSWTFQHKTKNIILSFLEINEEVHIGWRYE